MLYPLSLLLIVVLSLFSGCVGSPTSQQQVHNNDTEQDESGLGGTGLIANESGLGGTGIIGEITGFGSLFINGIEVELNTHTLISLNGVRIKDYRFARGDVVEIHADKQALGVYAREIRINNLVIGQVDDVNLSAHSMQVLGQHIILPEQIRLPSIADFVQISGFRDSQQNIHASGIKHIPAQKQIWLSGKATKVNNKTLRIGKQPIDVSSISPIDLSQTLNVHGTLYNGRILAKSIKSQKSIIQNPSILSLSIQGYIQQQGNSYRIGELPIKIEKGRIKSNIPINQTLRMEIQRKPGGTWQLKRIISSQTLPLGQPLPTAHQSIDIPAQIQPRTPVRIPMNIPKRPQIQRGRFMR